jgi:predicted DNA-binding transcriptional regulator
MPTQNETNEAMVLNVLQDQRSIRLEEIVRRLPQLSWNQVFQSVDSLSRRGDIILMQRGFDYEIERPARKPDVISCAV